HIGMQDVLPQLNLPDNNSLMYRLPRVGKRVRVIEGDPISFDDLIADFEAKHGPRRVVRINEDTDAMEGWEGSTEAERELYSRVTRRIELALEELEREHR